jgi:hypothetical protein
MAVGVLVSISKGSFHTILAETKNAEERFPVNGLCYTSTVYATHLYYTVHCCSYVNRQLRDTTDIRKRKIESMMCMQRKREIKI